MVEVNSKVGEWTVISKKDSLYFTCRCSCGRIKDVYKYSLIKNKSNSCGCIPSTKADKTSIVGKRFGKLTVISYSHKDKWGCSHFLCKCDCGKENIINSNSLKRGNSKSCGLCTRGSHHHTTHDWKSKTYNSWCSMITRCTKKNSTGYKYWGGRGIKITPRWFDFKNFLEDMGQRPHGTTLDRINNNGNYNKRNCRWATWKEQASNRRKNVY